MENRYAELARHNLTTLYGGPLEDLETRLGARREGDRFHFRAFGQPCSLTPEGIFLARRKLCDPRAVVISLYALHAVPEPLQLHPFKAFRELPGSMPYQGAFASHSERVLVPAAERIAKSYETVVAALDGQPGGAEYGGDVSFVLKPLPKIALAYILHLADEEFPAAVTCLFSANAAAFLPLDGLADTAEYTSRRLIELAAEG